MHFLPAWILLFVVPILQVSERSGIKMTVRFGQGENSNERIEYLSDDRTRTEFRGSVGERKPDGSLQTIYGPRMVAITRCDLGQMFELNLDSAEYTSAPYPPKPFTKEQIEARGLQSPPPSAAATLRLEANTTDTGERKEMFGHIARHVITTRRQIPLEGSRSAPQESVTDAWYIDLDTRLSCDYHWPAVKQPRGYTWSVGGNAAREKVEFIAIGAPDSGFPLHAVTTTKATYALPDGARKDLNSTSEMLVTQFEEGPLDPTLFEIPAGFRHTQHIERDPLPSASSHPVEYLWQRFKASVTRLFGL
jgi:hypothetical protein